MMGLIAAIFWLELMARIAGPPKHGPYLVSLTASEPMTALDNVLYSAIDPDTV